MHKLLPLFYVHFPMVDGLFVATIPIVIVIICCCCCLLATHHIKSARKWFLAYFELLRTPQLLGMGIEKKETEVGDFPLLIELCTHTTDQVYILNLKIGLQYMLNTKKILTLAMSITTVSVWEKAG